MRWTGVVAIVAGFVATTGSVRAQNQAASPSFEVASIKESSSVDIDGVFRETPGRFSVENLSLRSIIQHAYRVRPYQLAGAPPWTDRAYNINATYGSGASDRDIPLMLQKLLAERFALRVHREQRELPMFALMPVRADRGLGPGISPSSLDCGDTLAVDRARQPAAPGGPRRPACTMFANNTFVRGFAQTMPNLAQALQTILGTPVVDRTGLTGAFDFTAKWTGGPVSPSVGDVSLDERTALLTALRDQLGLKLEPARGPFEVIVVDSIQRPTPD